MRNEKGEKPAVAEPGSFGMLGGGSSWSAPVLKVSRASFLQNVSRHHIDGSIIIVDADAIEGFTLRQLGDYTAMRGLAKIRPPENAGGLMSILSMFDRPKSEAPRELTAFDRRYLKGLYLRLGSKGFESSVSERQRLAKKISGD